MQKIIIANQTVAGTTLDIANALARAGCEVELVAATRHGDALSRLDKKIRVLKICAYNRRNRLFRATTWLFGTLQILRIFRKNPAAKLLIFSNPPSATLLPLFFKNAFSLVIFDIYPDALVVAGIVPAKSFLVKKWEAFNRRIFARAGTVFTIGEKMRARLADFVPAEKIEVVPLWADTDTFPQVEKSKNLFLQKHNLTGKFVLTYAGNLGATHAVEPLAALAEKFRDDENFSLLVIANGAGTAQLKSLIAQKKLKNICFLPPQPEDAFALALAGTDLSLITLTPSATPVSVPSKTFSALAAGSALLCFAGTDSDLAEICRRHALGETFSPEAIDSAADFIRELMRVPEKLARLRANARNVAEQHFSPRNAQKFVEKFLQTF